MHNLKIATACFVNPRQELLVVRKKNTSAWMLPGGKLDADETPAKALIREIREELQLEIAESLLKPLGVFDAVAANEADTTVHAHAFLIQLPQGQSPSHAAEIAEMKWLPLSQPVPMDVAPLLRNFIIPALQS
ncbi:MAG: NUDIX domain-containing protein [Comamonas sp.]|jgi:8-oxo-dGTP pyrophosphatase MutT (NUDIX family)|nr:NUDIX domain-containing protein [Comamonas sp.]